MLGRHHPLFRRVRALRRDAGRRRAEGLFLAEGLHLAREALASGATIDQVITSPRLQRCPGGPELLDAIGVRKLRHAETADTVLDGLQDARSAQPILCLVRLPPSNEEQVVRRLAAGDPVTVVCGVQDPGNLGAILRIVDAACGGVLWATGDTADLLHPRAVRASMGAVFRVPFVVDPPRVCLGLLAAEGYRLLGADPRGRRDFREADLRGRVAITLGAEGGGLPPQIRPHLDTTLRIPMRPGVESLSVSAAAAVLLFETARQRATPPARDA